MGVDYHAYAAIGVAVDHDKLYRKGRSKTSNHDFGEDVLFHPQTGRQLWRDMAVRIDDPEEDDEPFLGKFPVRAGTPDAKGRSCIYVICATPPAEDDDSDGAGMKPLALENLPAAKEALRASLEPLGLWDESLFGLHAILYCSY